MTCQQYYETFKNSADVLEYCGGALGKEPGLVDTELETAGVDQDFATGNELMAAKAVAREHVLAIALLVGSN